MILPCGAATYLYGDTDKWAHGYTTAYQRHFRSLRYRRNCVWEIGVGSESHRTRGGGSLRIWRDFFPRSRIIGVDIHKKDLDLGNRVDVVVADQASVTDLERLVKDFGTPNVVIDDGSHMAQHAWVTFSFLWPLMPTGSVYAIEDLHTSYWPSFGGDPESPSRETAIGLVKHLVDVVQLVDPTFDWGFGGPPKVKDPVQSLTSMHLYPGLVVLTKG